MIIEDPNAQNLKYGIIYVIGNPKQTHNLHWFASMIEPMIRPLSLEWVETWDLDHTLIVARRFNVGNLGKYATVQLHLNRYGRSDSFSLLAAVHAFSDCLQDVMDGSEGDVIINEEDYSDRNALPEGKWGASTSSTPIGDVMRNIVLPDLDMPQDHTRVELPKSRGRESFSIERDITLSSSAPGEAKEEKPSLGKRLKKLGRKLRRQEQYDIWREEEQQIRWQQEKRVREDEESYADYCGSEPCVESSEDATTTDLIQYQVEPETVDIEAAEVREFEKINSEYERDVRDLRARIVAFITKYHQDPQQVMTKMLEGKVLLGPTPGHVLVNGDMKIVLPEYDETEIKMPAMCRTLYILFMKHRVQSGSGIILKNIDEYRDEIIDIYSLVKPGANDSKVEESVNNLCNPLGDSLNQMISRANRCIRNVITDKKLVKQYMITGEKGKPYGITLDPELIELPRAVTGAE